MYIFHEGTNDVEEYKLKALKQNLQPSKDTTCRTCRSLRKHVEIGNIDCSLLLH